MAAFSSRGPTWIDFAAKPDLVAPGIGIESLADPHSMLYATHAAVSARAARQSTLGYKPYLSLSGTSMAAPVVAGTVALMLQANPKLTPNAVKAILQYTAQAREQYQLLTQGAGFLNARGAVRLARFFAHRRRASATWRDTIAGRLVPWARQLIWGNYRVTGGMPLPGAQCLDATGVRWGATRDIDRCTTSSGARGSTTTSSGALRRRQHRVGHRRRRQHRLGHGGDDNIVWGTGGDDNIVWGTAGDDNIVWGTGDGDNIVWGTGGDDNIVWGTDGGDNIVWGTGALENIVWGTDCADATATTCGARRRTASSWARRHATTTSCGAPPATTTSCGALLVMPTTTSCGAPRATTTSSGAPAATTTSCGAPGYDNIVWSTSEALEEVLWDRRT